MMHAKCNRTALTFCSIYKSNFDGILNIDRRKFSDVALAHRDEDIVNNIVSMVVCSHT